MKVFLFCVSQEILNVSSSHFQGKCQYYRHLLQWRIQGRGPGGPSPHLIFSEIAHFLWSAGIIFAEFNIHSQAAPLLSWRSGSATALHTILRGIKWLIDTFWVLLCKLRCCCWLKRLYNRPTKKIHFLVPCNKIFKLLRIKFAQHNSQTIFSILCETK